MVPAALRSRASWLTWVYLSGKKPPCGQDARPLKDWREHATLTYEQALEQLRALPVPAAPDGEHPSSGLGLHCATGCDLDDCFDMTSGVLLPAAQALLNALPGYAERSPSGRGLKVFFRVNPPGWLEVNFHGGDSAPTAERKSPLYFAVTGDVLRDGDPDADGTTALAEIEAYYSSRSTERERENKLTATIQPGSQNVMLFKEACRHARDGKSETEIAAFVKAVALERCAPQPGAAPWTDRDFEAIARSASRYRPADDPFPLTETGDGEHFERLHADSVRYDHRAGRWLVFDGARWEPDPMKRLNEMVVQSMRTRLRNAIDSNADNRKASVAWAVAGESVTRISHCLVSASSKPALASRGDEWDSNPWLLGVPNGVVDLRTGELRLGKPEDHVTMRAGAAYDPEAQCPVWLETLKDVFQDKPADFLPYLQRALGYSVTGDMREEVFFLLTGIGRNGKGTIVNTVVAALGDYADSLKFASLEINRASYGGAGPTPDTAKLVRKRFVVASEGSGAALNTALIKSITGRDPMTTRGLHQNEFTFQPELKLWLTAQSEKRPKVKDDSVGFWARPHEVQFAQCYLGREDMTLKNKLLHELPGVLAWLVRGALEWQRSGLRAPACVTAAVEEYRHSQEPLAGFYDARCVIAPGLFASSDDLRAAYLSHCDEERSWSRLGPKQFHVELSRRFLRHQTSGGDGATRQRGYAGIGLVGQGDDQLSL